MNTHTPHRTHTVSSILAAILAVASSGCNKPGVAESRETGDPTVQSGKIVFPEASGQLAAIGTAPAKRCAGCRLRLNGRLAWDDDVTVRLFSPFAGKMTGVHVVAGQRVAKDSALASIASPDFGQVQADARKAATDLSMAERNVSRLRELAGVGAAAAKDVAEAEADLKRAQSEEQRARARLSMYTVPTDGPDTAYTLRAPVEGVVVERNANVGQEVRPDQMLAGVERIAAPLFTVTDPTKLWLLLDVTESDAARIEVGQRLQVRSDADPSHACPAVLEYESDALDPVTRTIKARALVDNGGRQLKAEQLVSVEVESPVASTVLSVPTSAVFLKGERHFVFAQAGPRTFERREVGIGASRDGQIQVTTGLGEGDRVVADGVMLLEQAWENASVDPATSGQSASL